jgi:phosphopantetheinyl transferase (holo-ACP synthase)
MRAALFPSLQKDLAGLETLTLNEAEHRFQTIRARADIQEIFYNQELKNTLKNLETLRARKEAAAEAFIAAARLQHRYDQLDIKHDQHRAEVFTAQATYETTLNQLAQTTLHANILNDTITEIEETAIKAGTILKDQYQAAEMHTKTAHSLDFKPN